MRTNPLTSGQVDELAREGRYVVTGARGKLAYDYDVTGYRRATRRDTPFGKFVPWDFAAPPVKSPPGPRPECADARPYLIRLGGFERGNLCTADEIGQLLRENLVIHTDGPGNGRCESLLIARKYGLRPVIEPSPWNLPWPVTPAQTERFRQQWERQFLSLRDWCERLGTTFGLDLVNDPEQIWVVLTEMDTQPLDVFLDQLEQGNEELNAIFRAQYGHDLPLGERPSTPRETAQRIHFWEFIRRHFSELTAMIIEVVRKHVRGLIVGNLEFDTEVDYRRWGEIYDVPGINLRPSLCEDEIGYRYWVGYGTRLSADLMHRAPMVSVRTNQVGAGPRIVPTRSTTRYWYSQAVQNGAQGFYLWVQDFQGDKRDPHAYTGPCLGNPDPSTRPRERWTTHLEAARQLGQTKVFQPPAAEVGVLVSIPSCAAGHWQSVFSAYVELSRAEIFVRFVSSADLRDGQGSLSGLRLLFVPCAPFEHRSVLRHVHEAVRSGLTLVVADPCSFRYDENGEENSERQRIFGFSGMQPRQACEEVTLRQDNESIRFRLYRPGWCLAPNKGVRIIGEYPDGGPAAIAHPLGDGQIITLGAPLLDLYTAGIRNLDQEDPARYRVYQHWQRCADAAAHSWVFDVTLDNLEQVTGPLPKPPLEMDQEIEFAPFWNVHS